MSSREEILGRIRGRKLADAPLPEADAQGIIYDQPQQQFVDTLKFVGGETIFVAQSSDLEPQLQRLDYVQHARQIVCLVPGLSLGNLDLDSVADPHDLASVDVAIVPGQLAVAENGAVWVSGTVMRQRAVCFLTQRLVLVVPRSALVSNMHEAYRQLSFAQSGYGVFISGPSKTADIEQSLVIGAHGSRSLLVALVG